MISFSSILCVIEVISEFEQGNEHPCDALASGAVHHNGAGAGNGAVVQGLTENVSENFSFLFSFGKGC